MKKGMLNTLSGLDDFIFSLIPVFRLDVLLTLCLSNDPATQEYATEAIAECLTLKSIQDQFVEIGGNFKNDL